MSDTPNQASLKSSENGSVLKGSVLKSSENNSAILKSSNDPNKSILKSSNDPNGSSLKSSEAPGSSSLKSSENSASLKSSSGSDSGSLKSSDGSLKSSSLKSSEGQGQGEGSLKSSEASLKSSNPSLKSSSPSLKESSSSLKSSDPSGSLKSSLKGSHSNESSLLAGSLKSSAGGASISSFSTWAKIAVNKNSEEQSPNQENDSVNKDETLASLGQIYDLSQLGFNAALFQSNLQTQLIGRFLSYVPITTSTMDVCKAEAQKGALSGSLFLAESQTSGRGRGSGRVWNSSPKGNLYFTVLLAPRSHASLPVLNFAFPLAVVQAILLHCPTVKPNIKWPNDIWVNGLKVCGMLLDVSSFGSILHVHAGVGINVNEDMNQALDTQIQTTATSLWNLTGSSVCREKLLASICNFLEKIILKYPTIESILPEYTQFDLLVNKQITVMPKKKENTESYYSAKCIGYTKDGYMRIVTQEGEEKILVNEEVSVRPN